MTHTGTLTRHSEAFIHLADREFPESGKVLLSEPSDGCVEVWRAAGWEAVGVEQRASVSAFTEGVHAGDVRSRSWLREVLGDRWFEVIHDRSGDLERAALLWPYLSCGGLLVLERISADCMVEIVRDFLIEDGVLPYEELLRVVAYHGGLVIEKRNPRVIDYLDAYTGKEDRLGVGGLWAREGAFRVDQAGGQPDKPA